MHDKNAYAKIFFGKKITTKRPKIAFRVKKMKQTTENIFNELLQRYPALADASKDINAAFVLLYECIERGNKILICGNGGSASDSEHIVGELMKSFKKKRAIKQDVKSRLEKNGARANMLANVLEGAIPAIALTSHPSLTTAFSNDNNPVAVYAQQLYGLGNNGDVLICLSTSGNSENCVLAAEVAKASDIKIVSLTGQKQSALSEISDVCIRVPETQTYKVQELHLPVYHCLCAMLEEEYFD